MRDNENSNSFIFQIRIVWKLAGSYLHMNIYVVGGRNQILGLWYLIIIYCRTYLSSLFQ